MHIDGNEMYKMKQSEDKGIHRVIMTDKEIANLSGEDILKLFINSNADVNKQFCDFVRLLKIFFEQKGVVNNVFN